MDLDVVLSQSAVETCEVKGADHAPNGLAPTPGLPDLAAAETAVAFPVQSPPSQKPSLACRRFPVISGLVGLRRYAVELPDPMP